jgi:hypothetical protein
VLDPLIDRQDGEITCMGKSSVAKKGLKTAESPDIAIREGKDPIDPVWAGQVERSFRNRLAAVFEKFFRIGCEYFLDFRVAHYLFQKL